MQQTKIFQFFNYIHYIKENIYMLEEDVLLWRFELQWIFLENNPLIVFSVWTLAATIHTKWCNDVGWHFLVVFGCMSSVTSVITNIFIYAKSIEHSYFPDHVIHAQQGDRHFTLNNLLQLFNISIYKRIAHRWYF